MNKQLETKLKKLPTTPGVYFHKDKSGEIIYVGKAANLRNRVRQYFQASRYRDLKTDLLVNDITDVDWVELESEADALFLEAELIRRYQPQYNLAQRDDKSSQYVRIDYSSDYPTVSMSRRPLDDGAKYFGPYINGFAVKKALRYLRRAFPYAISKPVNQKRANLYYHLGLDPGLEDGKTTLADYRANLRKLMEYLSGNRKSLIREIEKDMKKAASKKEFERAALLRNQLYCLQQLNRQVLFGDRELLDASRDYALVELAELLCLYEEHQVTHLDEMQGEDEQRTGSYEEYGEGAAQSATQQLDKSSGGVPGSAGKQARTLRRLKRIEGFDISHIQGSDNAASMVVFTNGVPEKTAYRKFKMRLLGNDDFGHMEEVVTRRFREENVKKWGLPNLLLIDGGKGQLSAAIKARDTKGQAKIPAIGLAKRHEEIIVPTDMPIDAAFVQKSDGFIREEAKYTTIVLPENSNLVKLLARIRDESHRFAVSYHSSLRRVRQTASTLDEIPGIGPSTRKKLIKHFGSLRSATIAPNAELASVIGSAKAASITKYFKPVKTS